MFEDESIDKQERKTWNWKRLVLLAVPVIIILVVILVLQPWDIAPGYESDITKAYAAMSDVESCRCSVISTSYDEYEEVTFQLIMEAEYVSPDRYYMKVMDDGQASELIIIGDVWYFTDSRLTEAMASGYTRLFNSVFSEENVSDSLNMLVDVQELPIEQIDGVNCIHYLGQWDVEKQIAETKRSLIEVQTSMGIEVDEEEIDRELEYMHSTTVSIEYWIGTDDYLIRQMGTNVQYPDDSEDFTTATVSMTTKFYDFYEPITIEAPVDADGQLLPGWQMDDTTYS